MKRYGYLLLLLPALLLAATSAAGELRPDVPKAAKGKQCVEDTEFMRRNHMQLLLHEREESVRLGIRSKKYSLKNCLTCHVVKDADGKPVTASDPRHFCRECHDYAAVRVDCWQCHASTPQGSAKALVKTGNKDISSKKAGKL